MTSVPLRYSRRHGPCAAAAPSSSCSPSSPRACTPALPKTRGSPTRPRAARRGVALPPRRPAHRQGGRSEGREGRQGVRRRLPRHTMPDQQRVPPRVEPHRRGVRRQGRPRRRRQLEQAGRPRRRRRTRQEVRRAVPDPQRPAQRGRRHVPGETHPRGVPAIADRQDPLPRPHRRPVRHRTPPAQQARRAATSPPPSTNTSPASRSRRRAPSRRDASSAESRSPAPTPE